MHLLDQESCSPRPFLIIKLVAVQRISTRGSCSSMKWPKARRSLGRLRIRPSVAGANCYSCLGLATMHHDVEVIRKGTLCMWKSRRKVVSQSTPPCLNFSFGSGTTGCSPYCVFGFPLSQRGLMASFSPVQRAHAQSNTNPHRFPTALMLSAAICTPW